MLIVLIILKKIRKSISHFQHAYALELLKDRLVDGEKALDVGSGSGYLTVCMSLMIGPNGFAVGIDHIPELVEKSIRNVQLDKPELLSSGRVKFVGKFVFLWMYVICVFIYMSTFNKFNCIGFVLVGDGRLGYPEEAPYNAIHVGAAAPSLPKEVSRKKNLIFVEQNSEMYLEIPVCILFFSVT